MEPDERRAIDRVVESLVICFPALPERSIRVCVDRVFATFIDAKVRSFIPILVAREARRELADLHAANDVVGDLRLPDREDDGDRDSDHRFGEVALEDTR